MQIANISITIFNHRKVSNYNMSCLVLMNVLFQFLPTTMAEALLVDDNWSTEVELEHPDGGPRTLMAGRTMSRREPGKTT